MNFTFRAVIIYFLIIASGVTVYFVARETIFSAEKKERAEGKEISRVASLAPVSRPEFQDPFVTMIFTGDIMLSRHIGEIMEEKNDWSFPFRMVGDFLKSADITFGNFENPVSLHGINQGSIYSFRADPRVIEGLLFAGFDVVSVANNHIRDYGPVALKDTLRLLFESNISSVGGGEDYEVAHRPAIKEVRGIKVAYLAYTDLLPQSVGTHNASPAVSFPGNGALETDIASAKREADIVVVSFHWGEEYRTSHNKKQEEIAHKAIDAGAVLVIGHHPHVVQEVEQYKNGYIAYSLGNFVFDQNFSRDTRRGLLLKVIAAKDRIIRVETVNISFNSLFQPFLSGSNSF